MSLHEIYVRPRGDDPIGHEVKQEAERTLEFTGLEQVRTAKVYRVEGVSDEEAAILAKEVFTDPISEIYTLDQPVGFSTPHRVEVAYKPGVMNPEAQSIMKAAHDLGIEPTAADSSRQYAFYGNVLTQQVDEIVGRLLMNKTVEQVVTEKPATLTFEGSVGPVNIVPVREASEEQLMKLSKDKLFLDAQEMSVIQKHFRKLDRDPTDAELEHIAAAWSEHCGHKTFHADVIVDGVRKEPFFSRIKNKSKQHFKELVVSAFGDNSGAIRFYDGQAICGKVETHNSPSAIEPYGGAMTGSGGVFRDIMGTGQGAKNIISTDMFCLAPLKVSDKVAQKVGLALEMAVDVLPPGTHPPDYLFRGVVQGVRDYGNRFGNPTANGSVHFHPDFRAKPSVIVGAYGILPEALAQKGEPQVGDLVVAIGGRTGRDGIHGATFSSGEMTERTANVNASAVQIGNAIEQKRMADALLEARDQGFIRAITDLGAAGFASAIGEMGEGIGVTVDISRAPLKYSGLTPYEIWISESQERMLAAISIENIEGFMEVCHKYNVEATVLGVFDGSHTLTVNYGEQNVIELDYEFLKNGLPQRVMYAHWEKPDMPEVKPSSPENEQDWVDRLKAVLAHGNVASKEPIVRQYDHGVQGGNIVAPYGGVTQEGPNDALVIRPLLGKPYGMVQSHGMNPILNRLDPYEGTVWAIAEAASNYVAVGGDIREAAAVGNYIWPYPDEEAMGSLDRSVDAAVDMMDVLGVPVISGKDSLSSTYRGKDGEVIKIPPVYTASIFGRIPDVEKTMTADIKAPGSSRLYLLGKPSAGMGGSTYYDVTGGSSAEIPVVDTEALPKTLRAVHSLIQNGHVLACHDVSEGGVIGAVAEMCFGGQSGAHLQAPNSPNKTEQFLFHETAGCFVVEVSETTDIYALKELKNVDIIPLGETTAEDNLSVNRYSDALAAVQLFDVSLSELKAAWQAPMKGIFHT